MECNKDEAIRAREIAQKKMQNNDFDGARKFAVKAQQLFPELENINHLLAVCNVHCSAQTRILGSEKDWYSILQVDRLADEVTIKKQYRKLALVLHPDKNQFPGAEAAFKLIGEAHLILSDRGKRSLYDSRTGTSFRSAQAKRPARQVNNNPPAQKQYGVQNNIPNGFNTQSKGLNHHQTTQSNSTVVRESFWTCCPFCGTRYQYYRDFVNRVMRCQKCLKQFIGYDIAAQGVPPATNQSQSASQGVPPRSNSSQPASQGVPPTSNYSQPSAAAGTHKTGAQKTTGYPSSNRKMGSDLGMKGNSAESGPSINSQKNKNSVGGGTEVVTSYKVDAMKPGEDVHPRNHKRKRGRKLEAKSSESCGTSSSSDLEDITIQENVSTAGAGKGTGVNGFYEPRRSSRQKHQVSYIESEGDDDDFESPPKKPREEKSSDSEKQQEALNPHCTPLKQKDNVPSKGSSPKENTQVSKHQMTGSTAAASNNFAKKVEVIDDSESDADDSESDADPGPKSYECPDPEFNDFDKLREGTCFAVNQCWACYDTVDGMPRFYAQIMKVCSPEFKLKFRWLEPNPDDQSEKKWVKEQLPVGCGKYIHGDTEESIDRLTFSHPVFCERGRKEGPFVVYPRHGETWALFKDWDITWSSDPENHQKFEYEIVEVLSDFVEGVGIRVAFLDKVKGFVSLFSRRSESTAGPILIRPKEIFKFSHQIPSFKMTGTEKEGIPKGCFELDPAALPIHECKESPNHVKVEVNDKNLAKSKLPENVSTPKKFNQFKGKSCFDVETGVPRRSPRGLTTTEKENNEVNAHHCSTQKGTDNYLNGKEGKSCSNVSPSKAEVLSCEADELVLKVPEASLRKSNSSHPSLSPSCNVSQGLFHDFNADKSEVKFAVGQIWALYKAKFPKIYGQIKKIGLGPFMLHVSLLESCLPPKNRIQPVCGAFKVQNGKAQTFARSSFSHLVAEPSRKIRFDIYPEEGQIWALYKSWNSELLSSDLENCECDVVEIISRSEDSIKVLSLVPLKRYQSVFTSRKHRSSGGAMEVQGNELARFSHQIPAFQLTAETGGSLAGCWELDSASVPYNVFASK